MNPQGAIDQEPARPIHYAPPALQKKSPWRIVWTVAFFVVLAVVAVSS